MAKKPTPKKAAAPKKPASSSRKKKSIIESTVKTKPYKLPVVLPNALVARAKNPRKYYSESRTHVPLPNLIETQLNSYNWFLTEGLEELFDEISPISDSSGKKLELHILKHAIEEPKLTPKEAKEKSGTYEGTLKVQVRLVNKVTGEIKEQEVFFGGVPLMTEKGTFIVNGIERVVVSQLVRSPGVFFSPNPIYPSYAAAKIIPKRGAWLELETDKRGIISVKIDRKRKIPVTALIRAFTGWDDEKILNNFKDVDRAGNLPFIATTLEKDPAKTVDEAAQLIYQKIRPGDLATPDNAKALIEQLFFDYRRYDMGPVGRYKLNKRFNLETPTDKKHRVFQVDDLMLIIKHLINLNNGIGKVDDIDHLSNRRIRAVGELVQNKFRVGLLRVDRIVRDRMTVMDLETAAPQQLINARPITAALREFYASSQLSQFMDQTNPLAELAHKRRLSAMGPGGLSRERAGFDVRDVHTSHYGRICPIATPEGPNIGLVVHLAAYARINKHGFIETPYYKVIQDAPIKIEEIIKRRAKTDIKEGNKILVKEGEMITKEGAKRLIEISKGEKKDKVPVRAYATHEFEYYDAEEEEAFKVAQANSEVDENGNFLNTRISARAGSEPMLAHVNDLTHIDVTPQQIFSMETALIPFLEHNDNTRASMGTNMQRQAVNLVRPHTPLVGTGTEAIVAQNSDQVVIAEEDGEVTSLDASAVTVVYKSGKRQTYGIQTYARSNQGTCISQRPVVDSGQKVKKGDILIEGAATDEGELALGQNLFVAYMSWHGCNFEDAVIISDRIAQQGYYDSVHIEDYVVDVRETKLGMEEVTRDIPNVSEERLKNLNEDGIIQVGSYVKEGDILAGKITPKGETELTAEERLLRAIFGEKARDMKDTSLRMPGGTGGKVIDVRLFTREDGVELPIGVVRQIHVHVAQRRQLQVGDKMAGRHGNKGVISTIVPIENMPFLPDGTPVDIILNPLGVTSRMNIGQILETHLGWVAKKTGMKFATPALNGIYTETITKLLKEHDLPEDGKIQLFDGLTGEPFDRKTTVGVAYMLKLNHLAEDKIHARSVGPYSLVTQQPLGGKAQHGGQRFGEMEVWALEAYGAANVLQEILTIKSDDVYGRSKAYEAIVKGEEIRRPRTPESFNVLVKELQALCLNVELLNLEGRNEMSEEEMLVAADEDEGLSVAVSKIPAGGAIIPEEDQISELQEEDSEDLDADPEELSAIEEMKESLETEDDEV
ncbi:MAG: DNA-directed RNA polymerase subunit beta [Candidatus Gracilibacteria bacterium]|nr:DNA-directed RNA polymerase subunit beta [Candidatus Gracilibacteria bacterium]MDD5178842.1 DNA-directed RNA polymerase subunit beta [Candidatus Gracilibacteria bacterium]